LLLLSSLQALVSYCSITWYHNPENLDLKEYCYVLCGKELPSGEYRETGV